MTLDEAQRLASRLRDELGRAIIGQHAVVHDVLTAFFAGGDCLLRGVPVLAKTLLINPLARAIHLKSNRIQFTPDLAGARSRSATRRSPARARPSRSRTATSRSR